MIFQPFPWECLYCGHKTTVNSNDLSTVREHLEVKSAIDQNLAIGATAIRCPNPACHQLTLTVRLYHAQFKHPQTWAFHTLAEWPLLPRSGAKVFPDYIPAAIRQDYEEACLIVNDSPKAAATLARRCLQGMIRDFWQVAPKRLVDEVEAIKDRVEPETWLAIDAVRSLGNIGAHMEKDVNLVVDVDPGEAEQLIALIETLLREWYVARHERQERMRTLVELAEKKKAERAGTTAGASTPPSDSATDDALPNLDTHEPPDIGAGARD